MPPWVPVDASVPASAVLVLICVQRGVTGSGIPRSEIRDGILDAQLLLEQERLRFECMGLLVRSFSRPVRDLDPSIQHSGSNFLAIDPPL